MMKKTLSLMIILSASLSTSLHARNAMRDITDYRKGLEQATVLNDQENVNIFAEALVGALTQAKITTAPKQKQTYDGNHQLPIQVKNANYRWGRKATKAQADELYRALDALAVVGYWEENDGRGKERLAQLLSRAFDSSQANKKTHIGLASKRYQATLQAIKERKSSSVLYALTQAAATQLPYAQSTYVGQVHINDVKHLVRFRYEDFYPASKPENGWIKGFYVKSEEDQKALKGTDISTFVKGVSGKGEGAFGWVPVPQHEAFAGHMGGFGGPMFGGGFGGGSSFSMEPSHDGERSDVFGSGIGSFGGWGGEFDGPSLSSHAPGQFGGGMEGLWGGAPFGMGRPGFGEGKEEQGLELELDEPPAYSAPQGGEIDLKAAEDDEREPGAAPPSYQVSKRSGVAAQLETLKNEKFTSIIGQLKGKSPKNLGTAIKGLTSIARKPADRDEFYHAFRALEALSVVDKGLFKNAAENKTWAELGAELIKDYAISVFKEKVPRSVAGGWGTEHYARIKYASSLERLTSNLLDAVSSWSDETDLQGVKAGLEEINQTEIGQQALTQALKSRPFAEVLAEIKLRIKDVRLTAEVIRVFKEKVPKSAESGWGTDHYRRIKYASLLEGLIPTLLEAAQGWTDETDLQGVSIALQTIHKNQVVGKGALDKALETRRTSYDAVLTRIRDRVVHAQAREVLKQTLTGQEATKIAWTPLKNILQQLLAKGIYEETEACLVILKKFIKTAEGQEALTTLQSEDNQGDLIPGNVKGASAEETAANIQKYVIETED